MDTDGDGDGVQDGTEKGLTTGVSNPDGACPLLGTNVAIFVADANSATVTSPTTAETDNDSSSDGVEDTNHNGRVDSGEYDPNSAASFPGTSTTTQQVPIMPIWAML